MKITSPWRRNNNTNKNKVVTPKPKIAWEQLGLKNRNAADASLSIDEIRRQVIQASNQALGQGLELHPPVDSARSSDGSRHAGSQPKAASKGNAVGGRRGVSAQRAKRSD